MNRRVIQRVVVFLLMGAIVNVAVAWGCAMRSWSFLGKRYQGQTQEWPRAAPSDFPMAQELSNDGKLGFRQIIATAQGEARYIESDWPGGGTVTTPRWIQSVNQCGFPLLSLEWINHYRSNNSANGGWEFGGIEPPTWMTNTLDLSKRFAEQPIWPGFAINTIFYAATLWLVFSVPLALRRRRRMQRGLCPACAYPIGTSPVCTECGKGILGV